MYGDEIEIPKELRPFMLEKAKETHLGQKNGAKKQYRYGNLHIREYDDKFLVHMDKIDPHKDPLGHLISDAPEVLIGFVCAVLGGKKISSTILNDTNSKTASLFSGLLSSIAMGYLGYITSKKIKEFTR